MYSAVRFGKLRAEATLIDGFRVYPFFSEAFSIPVCLTTAISCQQSVFIFILLFPPLQHETLLSSQLSFLGRLMSPSRESENERADANV